MAGWLLASRASIESAPAERAQLDRTKKRLPGITNLLFLAFAQSIRSEENLGFSLILQL